MIVRTLGHVAYVPTLVAMQEFTAARMPDTPDEIWLCEHPPVFTQGLSGKAEHLLQDIGIPVVQIDRGGQITYHGPGQLVAYLLLDMRRRGLTIRPLVRLMEQAVINLLAEYDIIARGRTDAPGVYVGDAKIAALGLRIKNGCCYHGLALNVDVDLAPFAVINPCGHAGLRVTRTRDLGISDGMEKLGDRLIRHLREVLP